jgi:hypothetical protein
MQTMRLENTLNVPRIEEYDQKHCPFKTDLPNNSTRLLTLVNKEQLNKIITNQDGTPDYLAINIYYDTLRSWYNPKIGYKKDGNVYYIDKLKTKGIFLNYKKLAQIHGCSKETIRAKIVKLETLGLVHRSFQHTKTETTKSCNRLIAYVWKDTPYFHNNFGVDRDQVPILKAQTNHKYIENKYGIIFASHAPQNKGLEEGGGIQTGLDTKELNNFKKEDRSSAHTHESNFSANSTIDIIQETSLDTKTPEVWEMKKEEVVGNERTGFDLDTQQKPVVTGLQSKYRIPNKRKKPTNSEKKAKVFYFNQYKTPENLAYHYPLNQDDCNKLQRLSGRPFHLNAMNEILLDMSKKLDRRFRSKACFLAYFSESLIHEKRDAVQTGNLNFRIKANLTEEDKQQRIQESFLSQIEQQAITSVCPENQLKARLANVLEKTKAYELLLHFRRLEVTRNVMQIYLTDSVELTAFEKSVVLRHVQSIYSTEEVSIAELEYIIDNSSIRKFASKPVTQAKLTLPEIPTGIWGEIRKVLISNYGADVDRNWFSKLTANVDEVASTIELKYPSQFVADWISTNYEDTIKAVVAGFGMNYKIN